MTDSEVIDITDEIEARKNAFQTDHDLELVLIDLSLEPTSSASNKKRKVVDVDLTTDEMNTDEDRAITYRISGDRAATSKTIRDHPQTLTTPSAVSTNTPASPLQSVDSGIKSSINRHEVGLCKRQRVDGPIIMITDHNRGSLAEHQEEGRNIGSRSLEDCEFRDSSNYIKPESVIEDDEIVISDDEPNLLEEGLSLDPLIELQDSRIFIDLLDADDGLTPVADTHCDLVIAEPIKVSKNGVVFTCAAGRTIEYRNGTFMKIEKLIYDAQMQVILIGKFLIRQNSFDAKVPKRRNEVVWVIDGIECHAIKPGWRVYREEDILRNRKLIMTNRPYPRSIDDVHHPRVHPDSYSNPTDDVNYGPLFCRMKLFCRTQRGRRDLEEIWQALSESEADDDARVNASRTRLEWRGPTAMGGSAVNFVFNGSSEAELVQSYTFGDSFCGAGGTSCGAKKAGLHITWSFDADPKPLETYKLNFPHVDIHEKFVHEFIEHAKGTDVLVDVLHLSPPCQPFSPAHTVSNAERDEPNQAALLSVSSLLQEVKPRVVTLEQTLGLESRHPEWFRALMHDFVRAGYSFHWKVVNCADYGVPQTRKRLIFLGAGPGERLPDFPKPTHGTGAGLNPLDTVRKVLDKVATGAPNHDTTRLMTNAKPPYDPNTTAKTVTCNGGVGNYHPSGLRKFTVREFACFQTFPLDFKLADVGLTQQRKQVGNAVPPLMAETFYRTIIESLKESDGVIGDGDR